MPHPLCDTERVESPRGKPVGESPLSGYLSGRALNHQEVALQLCNVTFIHEGFASSWIIIILFQYINDIMME